MYTTNNSIMVLQGEYLRYSGFVGKTTEEILETLCSLSALIPKDGKISFGQFATRIASIEQIVPEYVTNKSLILTIRFKHRLTEAELMNFRDEISNALMVLGPSVCAGTPNFFALYGEDQGLCAMMTGAMERPALLQGLYLDLGEESVLPPTYGKVFLALSRRDQIDM